MKWLGWWICAALIAGVPAGSVAVAAPVQSAGNPWRLCHDATAARERSANIPRHLLGAIALAESGRWNAEQGANSAWPWTVMAEGRGRFFDSKAEAIAEVEALQDRGITNIDVGCMQINLHYHADAFGDLDEAFDPRANVAYGAEHLTAEFAETRSWHRAAGRYHSATPEYEQPYRVKVLALWNERRRLARDAMRGDDRPTPTAIDHDRTESLNARLRSARAAERSGRAGVQAVTATSTDWRQRRPRPNIDLRHEKIVAQVMRTQRRLGIRGPRAERIFADRRRRQLQHWRLRRVPDADAAL